VGEKVRKVALKIHPVKKHNLMICLRNLSFSGEIPKTTSQEELLVFFGIILLPAKFKDSTCYGDCQFSWLRFSRSALDQEN
jgi:hypothetical protein